MKKIHKLRRDLKEAAESREFYKNKSMKLVVENEKLKQQIHKFHLQDVLRQQAKETVIDPLLQHLESDSSSSHQFFSDEKEVVEPKVTYATIRAADDSDCPDFDIECRFEDGQKFSAIKVDSEFPNLAESIINFLNQNSQKEVVDTPTNFSDRDKIQQWIKNDSAFPELNAENASSIGESIKVKTTQYDVAFSSRFMPNVAFRVIEDDYLKLGLEWINGHKEVLVKTDSKSDITHVYFGGEFDESKIISKYQAAPELIPEGMVYDKESDSLVEIKKEQKTFSSRFMPNVKFKAPEITDEPIDVCCRFNHNHANRPFFFGYCVVADNHLSGFRTEDDYTECSLLEVSIYEAIPELVPNGIVYSKKHDRLVGKFTFNRNENIKQALKMSDKEIKDEIKDLLSDKKSDSSAPTSFSSRFMPNVKFIVPFEHCLLFKDSQITQLGNKFICTDNEGCIFSPHLMGEFNSLRLVSIYEAMPELVPEGMLYDKESDSLVTTLHKGLDVARDHFEYEIPKVDAAESLTTCPHCKGYGFIEHHTFNLGMVHTSCSACDGLGMVKKS